MLLLQAVEGIAESVASGVAERLGDGKQSVRDEAQRVLLSLAAGGGDDSSSSSNIGAVVGALGGGESLGHRNWRVREQALLCIGAIVAQHGPRAAAVQERLDAAIALLEDPNANVRKACAACLEQAYVRMGPRLLARIERASVRPALVAALSEQLASVPLAPPDQMFSSAELQQQPQQQPQQRLGATQAKRPKSKEAPAKPRSRERPTGIAAAVAAAPQQQRGDTPPPVVHVASERQLAKEIEDIASALSSLENDWERRVAALRRLQGLVRGGAQNMPGFMQLFLSSLKMPVAEQCLDLRSLVSKESGRCIETLSVVLGEALEPATDAFVETLFKLASTANKVMAEGGNQAMRAMLLHSRINRVGVSKILETLSTSKSSLLRQRAAEYLCIVLQQGRRYVGNGTLERYLDQIQSAIGSSVSDSAPGVRAAVRIAYWHFSALWKDRAARLFDKFEPNVRRLVKEDERKAFSGDLASNAFSSTGGSSSSQHSSSSSPAVMVRPKHMATSVAAAAASAAAAGDTGPVRSTSGDFSSLTAMKRVPSKPETDAPGGMSFTPASDVRRMFAPAAKRTGGVQAPAPAAAPAELDSLPGLRSRSMSTGKALAHVPPAYVPPLDEQPPGAAPVLAASVMNASGKGRPAGTLSSFRYVSQQAVAAAASASAAPIPLVTTVSASSSPRTSFRAASESPVPVLDAAGFEPAAPKLTDVASMVEGATSSDWATRLAALSGLRTTLSGPSARTLIPLMDRVVAVLEKALDDVHSRVAREALELLRFFIQSDMRGLVAPALGRLLPPVLRKVSASTNQQELRLLAENTQDDFLSFVDPSMLVPSVVRLLEQRVSNAKILLPGVEVLRAALVRFPGYFAASFHIKPLVPPLVALLGERSQDTREAALGLLQLAFESHRDEFVSAVTGLGAADFQECRKVLAPLMPDLDADLSSRSGISESRRGHSVRTTSPPTSAGLMRLAETLQGERNRTRCLTTLAAISDMLVFGAAIDAPASECAVTAVAALTPSSVGEDRLRLQAFSALQKIVAVTPLTSAAIKRVFLASADVLIETLERPNEPALLAATALLSKLEQHADHLAYARVLLGLCGEMASQPRTMEVVFRELSKVLVRVEKEAFLSVASDVVATFKPLLDSDDRACRRDSVYCLADCSNAFGSAVIAPFLAQLTQTQRSLIAKVAITRKAKAPF